MSAADQGRTAAQTEVYITEVDPALAHPPEADLLHRLPQAEPEAG
jgi:hypothetical protein